MRDDASKSRLSRALGATLLVLIAVAALRAGHGHWMTKDVGHGLDPAEVRLDLAAAFRFAWRRPNGAGAAPDLDGNRVTLPTGTAVAWSLRIPHHGGFAAARIEAPTTVADGAEMHVENDAGLQRTFPLSACTQQCRVPLDEFAGSVARVTARAPRGVPSANRKLVLHAPVIHGDAPPASPASSGSSERPPVIIYLMDTLRADKVGAYGGETAITPEIDEFAAEATVFEEAIAQAPWTKPSVASIFTGQFARVHKIMTMAGVLPDAALTLAEIFGGHGYETGAVVTNGLVDADFGFDQGFDLFLREKGRVPDVPGITGFRADKPAIDSDVARSALLPWLDEREPGLPFLLYVHVLDPHTPHFPPEPFKGRFVPELDRFDLGSMESVRALDEASKDGGLPSVRDRKQLESLYDAEIAHNDHEFGLFLDDLRARGLYDEALIVLVSDHGEAFWEHGYRGHGRGLHEELLRVPLIVKAPRQREARRVRSLAQHVDLLPTFADYAGIPLSDAGHGASLRPLIELGDEARAGLEPTIGVSSGMPGTAIRQGQWKLVKRSGAQHPLELYDLEVDPGETRNLARKHPVLVRYLLEEVARVEASTPQTIESVEREIGDEKADELRALGYIE